MKTVRFLAALALATLCVTPLSIAQSVTGNAAVANSAAGPARGINFATVLTDQDDQPIMDCAKADPGPPVKCIQETKMTLGRIALGSLNRQDPALTDTDNVRRYYLMLKVYKATEPVELDAGDIDLIRRQIVKTGYPPLWVGRALEILDPVGMRK